MKWKFLAVVSVILLTMGFLLFTEQGREYAVSLGSITRSLFGTVGNFVGSMVKIPGREEFNFGLELNKEAIKGQKFSFYNELKASGWVLSLKIDEKIWEIDEKIEIELVGNGEVLVENDGKLSLKAEASTLKLNSWKTSNVKVEIKILPENLIVNNAKTDLMNVTSASGVVTKQLEGIELKASFDQANLKVESFKGVIEFGEKLKLTGTATSIEINGKKI